MPFIKRIISVEFDVNVNTSKEKLFAFHCEPKNLPKITPPWISVEILQQPTEVQAGSKVLLKIKRLGIGQMWHMNIAAFKESELLVDEAMESPFDFFRHERHFSSIGSNKSKLTDKIYFALPWYPLSLLVLPLIRQDIKKMFLYRHHHTKALLEKNYV